MICPCQDDQLAAWVLELLDERAARKIQEHVHACAACGARAQSLRAAAGLLGEAALAPPADLTARVLARARTVRPQTPLRAWWWTPVVATAAFAALWILVPRGAGRLKPTAAEIVQAYQGDLEALGFSTPAPAETDEVPLEYESIGL